jgi:hypothetical protein
MSNSEVRTSTQVYDEVTRWFFDDYLATWVGVGAGTIARGPEFVLDYWGVPLHYSTDQESQWLIDASAVVGLLEQTHARLQAQGYAHTAVPDYQVFVYNDAGAAIEVIWSRRRADDSEIERLAAHFELGKGPAGWRVVGIQTVLTEAESLDAAWPAAK